MNTILAEIVGEKKQDTVTVKSKFTGALGEKILIQRSWLRGFLPCVIVGTAQQAGETVYKLRRDD